MLGLTSLQTWLLLLIGFGLLFFLLFRLSNRKLVAKIQWLVGKNSELLQSIEKISQARLSDSAEMKKRIESLEEKVAMLANPPSQEKETEREKAFPLEIRAPPRIQ
ncbi:Uncharacterised protein [uncultured archaeon]|nr:Uncharacterised protein [uncultured archaeon]